MINNLRPELDADTRYYFQQRDKAVKIALSKIYGGKILHPAQKGAPEIHDKQKEGHTNERRSTKADRRAP